MSRAKTRLFITALDELEASAAAIRNALENDGLPDSDEIAALDDALEAVLSTRNDYCADGSYEIEDGAISWTQSQAQIEASKGDS
jgi:hypothetical protein